MHRHTLAELSRLLRERKISSQELTRHFLTRAKAHNPRLNAFLTLSEDKTLAQARAALVTSEKSNSVKVKVTANLLEITASSPDFGEAHESMAISYSGPDLQVAFNPQFVMDPLRALTKDEVFFELKDEVSPGVFKTLESFVCVIMPVRLS